MAKTSLTCFRPAPILASLFCFALTALACAPKIILAPNLSPRGHGGALGTQVPNSPAWRAALCAPGPYVCRATGADIACRAQPPDAFSSHLLANAATEDD